MNPRARTLRHHARRQLSQRSISQPSLEPGRILVARLGVEDLALPSPAERLPRHRVCAHRDMSAVHPRILPELHEEQTTVARIRGMPKTLRIEQVAARRPIAVLVREHTGEDENLLAVRVVMRRKLRVLLVAYDGSHLTRFRRADQVQTLAPHRAAGTCGPGHGVRVHHDTNREIAVYWAGFR